MSWRGPPTPPGKNRARPAEIFRTARRNLKLQKEEDDADDGNLMGTWPGRAAAPAAKRAVGAGRRSSRHFLNHCFRYISRVSEPYSCSETPYRHSYHFWRDYRRSFIWSYFIHGTLMYLGAFVSRQPTYSLWFYRWCGRDDAWIPLLSGDVAQFWDLCLRYRRLKAHIFRSASSLSMYSSAHGIGNGWYEQIAKMQKVI